ncbi:MAG: TIGR01212 family radical SAM protein, partial [Chitinispirillaceae bacterium]|nr:TIGR01212 family radical SAM protein [Chitinispirillaceae bacterium]
MPHYNTYSFFLKKKFGSPVKKVPVNAGFSCPNRDGTKSSAGCAFCDNRVFSPVAAVSTPPIEQLASAMRRAGNRYTKFLAYLQPYSNTFGTIEKIRDVCESLIAVPGVVGICIGTRPDCISDDAFEYLAGLARRTYVSVELGLQSSHDRTLSLVNRGHTFDEFAAAARRLHSLGIEPVAHVMLGLPGETDDMMFETADRLAVLPVDGVKLHQVMIIRGTLFETWFSEG